MNHMKDRSRANMIRARDAAYLDAGDRVRFQASFAEKLLNALLVANGGAIIGLFTFVGNIVGKAASPIRLSPPALWIAFACFVLGLGLALAAHIFAFLSQQEFYFQSMEEVSRQERALIQDEPQMDRTLERQFNEKGTKRYAQGVLVASGSIILFVVGCGAALYGLMPG